MKALLETLLDGLETVKIIEEEGDVELPRWIDSANTRKRKESFEKYKKENGKGCPAAKRAKV